MPLFQTKLVKNRTIILIGFLISIFLIAGCVAQKEESVQTAETVQVKANEVVPIQEVTRQISHITVENADQNLHVKIQGNKKFLQPLQVHQLIREYQ